MGKSGRGSDPSRPSRRTDRFNRRARRWTGVAHGRESQSCPKRLRNSDRENKRVIKQRGMRSDDVCPEHHGSRVIRRSCSHERIGFNGDRDIASRHASRLILGASGDRCRRTRTNRSSPWRWTSKMSPGLAPGITTRLLGSARTAFMDGDFPFAISPVKVTIRSRLRLFAIVTGSRPPD